MSARKWTESQRSAINTRDRTLLVSAAAGSGKTATLTERIITSILDEKAPINIEQMLIVTYTRAAVGELVDRISKAIKDAMLADPGNAHLEHQLHMLPCAKICTIDSFCADILRANAETVGITPAFRIPDGAEAQLIAENLLDGLLGEIYEGDAMDIATPAEIDMLTDCLAGAKNQGDLPLIIRKLYASTLHSIEGVGSIGMLVDEYDIEKFTAVEMTGFGRYIMNELSMMLTHYKNAFTSMLLEVEERQDDKLVKIKTSLTELIDFIAHIQGLDKYEDVRSCLLNYQFSATVPVKKDLGLPPITTVRKEFIDKIREYTDKFFSQSEEEWRIAYTGLYSMCGILYRVIKEFDDRFKREKIRRGICEFSDVERYTYECLWNDGERTDIATEQSKLYKAVYIDEYQDVNSLQNKIFEAISSETNRFMVGDIKQSIYEFRSANPRIFAEMKKTYPPLGTAGDHPYASIFMSDNFRCDKGVIDFVNDVFDKLFYYLRDSIGYVDGDRLNFSKIYDHEIPEYRYPEICLVNTFSSKDKRSELIDDASALAPEVVACKIKELLDDGYLDNGEKIEPKHIAIIMRSVKSKGEIYSQALSRLGIPSALAEETRFFMGSDVLLVLCLLNSIDNPLKDIYLSGLMCSPMFGFTVGDLAIIRKCAAGATLYDSLLKYVEIGEDEGRVAAFLEKLKYYRLISEGIPTDKLIMKLYHETGILALAANNTESKDNLMLLYEHARKFESGSFKGLYNFINYINQLTGRENEFDKREAPGECDAVRIITAHGSKGLEYPVVFFTAAEKSLSHSDIGAAPRFEYEEGFGIGMFLRTPSGLALVKNATKDVIKAYRHKRTVEEEARVLYVILTRARERLYVVGNVGVNPDGFLEGVAAAREYMSEYGIYNAGSFLKLMLSMKDFEVKSPAEFLKEPPYVYTEEALASDAEVQIPPTAVLAEADEAVGEPMGDIDAIAAELSARFGFEYPNAHMTRLPGKLSVSRLYPAILDEGEEGISDICIDEMNEAGDDCAPILPRFRTGTDERESAKRGIATHMLLQFCDFDLLTENGAEAELKRLTEKGFLSSSDALLVRLKEVERFRNSKLLSDIRSAKKIYRELRFNVKLPADRFTEDGDTRAALAGEYVLVQGVIDCLYVDADGEYHLIDYKTDRLSKDEFADRELARQKMYDKHSLQLSYYRLAVKEIFGVYPSSVEVYSLPLGTTLDVMHKE